MEVRSIEGSTLFKGSASKTEAFYKVLGLIFGLSRIEVSMMYYASCSLNEHGMFYNNLEFKSKFKAYMEERKTPYKNRSSVDRTLMDLQQKGLVIRETRGVYKIHPDYIIPRSEEITFNIKLDPRGRHKVEVLW